MGEVTGVTEERLGQALGRGTEGAPRVKALLYVVLGNAAKSGLYTLHLF